MNMASNNKNIWAVLPLKGLKDAKKRLSNILSPTERARLVTAMAHDMLSALCAASSLGGVMVISNDDDIKTLAANYPVELIPEGSKKGLSAAISHAATILADRGINAMLVIHGDIPLVTPDDINAIIEASLPEPSITIAPCSRKDGTNVMVCSPPDAIDFQYGKKSFEKHVQAALNIGIKSSEFLNHHLELDIDTADDLCILMGHLDKGEVGERTTALLKELNLANRLF